jgi:hypothetical protein
MAYSIGQNFFEDILQYSDKNSKDTTETAYELQARLGIFFKNNGGPTLLKSEKYSGEVGLNGKKEPLGGPINFARNGYGNAPGTPFLSSEFPFWSANDEFKVENAKNKIENFGNTNVANYVDTNDYTSTTSNNKEYFSPDEDTLSSVLKILIPILILIIIVFCILYIVPQFTKHA